MSTDRATCEVCGHIHTSFHIMGMCQALVGEGMSATFCRCIHVNGTPTDAPPTPDTMPAPGPERDRLVAEALGWTVVGTCYDMGEGLVDRPDGRPAPLRYAQVDKCVCPAVAHVGDFAADHAHWGHSWHCLKPVSQSSTSNHAAYDVLEAWKRGGNRVVIIKLLGTLPTWAAPHPTSDMVQVSLYDVDRWAPTCDARVIAPTLGDAASRAIIEATRREG